MGWVRCVCTLEHPKSSLAPRFSGSLVCTRHHSWLRLLRQAKQRHTDTAGYFYLTSENSVNLLLSTSNKLRQFSFLVLKTQEKKAAAWCFVAAAADRTPD